MTPEEKEAKIFAMQSPSTQRAMLAHKSLKPGERRNQLDDWPPKGWKAYEGEITEENYLEKVGARKLTEEEKLIYNGNEEKGIYGMRQKTGERLAEIYGDKAATSMTPGKLQKAINAFMGIPQTFVEIMESWGLKSKKREFDYAETLKKEKDLVK